MGEKPKNNAWDILGKYLTFVIVAIYLVYILNGIFNFIPLGTVWVDIVHYLTYYGPMAVVIVTSIEAIDTHKGIFRTLLILCWVFIVLFSISPNLFGLIK